MESEDSRDANSRDAPSSSSSSSYDEDGPASPVDPSRHESQSEGPDSPVDRAGSVDKLESQFDSNSAGRPDSWNGQNENSVGDGPESPSDSVANADHPKSPLSSDNSGPNSPNFDGPMSPKSDAGKEPQSPDNSSVKSPLSNQSSPRRLESSSPKSHKSSQSERRSRNANSESSQSSRESSTSRSRLPVPPMEEISDCDMESDHNSDNDDNNSYSNQRNISSPMSVKSLSKVNENNLNLSHEDLSDVSDLDSNPQSDMEDSKPVKSPVQAPKVTDLRQKLDEAKKNQSNGADKIISKSPEAPKHPTPLTTHKTPDDTEEALDFEAEEGECPVEQPKVDTNGKAEAPDDKSIEDNDGEIEEGEELEEGEVTDGDENRPEETEPRPVCRFFARGQCTWGISCRFLHPGVTDKGNYTMFDMVRPITAGPPGHPPGFGLHHDFRTQRPVPMFAPPAAGRGVAGGGAPVVESAWERGLRTAKEMMRKANKRKEQDMDFEEKKMNLTIGQDEIERENGYYARAASPPRALSPEIPYVKPRHIIPHEGLIPRKEEYLRRHYDESRLIRMEPPIYDEMTIHDRERLPRYRELPPHRMPQYEEDEIVPPDGIKRRPRPTREVIVQRAEPATRGDEWADPWMRSKSPGSRRPKERTARRSYSSGSSYSSSSSSSSAGGGGRSNKSRSPRSRSPRSRELGAASGRRRGRVSPSVIVSERRAASERALLMNPPAPSPRKRPHSPAMMRRHAQNPPAPVNASRSNAKGLLKINRDQTDAFGRVRRDMDRLASERNRRDSLTGSSKGSRKSPYKRDSRRRDGRSVSSNSGSSDSSSSDSGSSYTSSSSSRDRSPSAANRKIGDSARVRNVADRTKGRVRSPLERKREDTRKVSESNRKRPANSPLKEDLRDKSNKSPNEPKKASRREELLKQLKAVEDAIARKRSKND